MIERVAQVWVHIEDAVSVLCVETAKGRLYEYERQFEDAEYAERMAERVREVAMIHVEYWRYVRAAYGTAAWFEDGFEQRQLEDERMGL